jgi:hypothetical protein
MKNILRLLASGIVAAVFALAAQAAELVPGAYSVGTVSGDVTYKLAGSSEFLPLAAGTALPQGVTIKTGADSSALLVFASGSTASISADSEVEIAKFEQEAFSGSIPADSEPSVSVTEVNVVNGDFTAKVSKLKKGSSYTVNTPVGAAGVRGTTFRVSYNASTGAYSLDVVEGNVVLASVTGQTVPVGPGRRAQRLLRDGQVELVELPPRAISDILRSIIGTIVTDRAVRQSLFDGNGISIKVDVNQVGVSPN